jgi:gamma-glutamyltranspeptidase
MPVFARNLVCTSQPLAAQAGLQMLQQGGNAVDAALATAITLTVVEPTMNGIGSDAFAILWNGEALHGLNASGCSPRAWSPEYFREHTSMPTQGWDAVTVPGCVSAWAALSDRFGKLPFADLFGAAIRHARDGWMVPPIVARSWNGAVQTLGGSTDFQDAFMPNGRAPGVGETFSFEAQAHTLERIAETRGFGSGVVVPDTGISLQNRGAGFVLEEGHPNQVAGGKRPYHTIIPAFATRDGQPVMSYGVMGGPMQPQGHAQMMIRLFDYGQNPQAACDAPR